ncbi:Por secretion system C-terminal sorting domain-containing protein [Pedobacter suwonensis]|uniref:Por secretion system C-terminal sorting domain-containing protein n=1 Tax=Pedobacter suwonensis TaxID=332999 RepID=A0A1I0TLR9_9SPHI|nr:T9SS type A sorting domain-containing protein [Pedobacter suwonensis]SFA52732.1 Por secretion system C-terminal sorting domain-containing protein [Pedobacter suwonensis]
MKRCALIITSCLLFFFKTSVAQKLAFSYDAAGNQTERRWVCINCPSARQMAMDKKTNNLPPGELGEGLVTERGIKAYPNPLKETLNVSWGAPDKIYLKSIQVYSVGGNSVFKRNYNTEERQTTITFQQLPPGTYLLVGQYSDAKTETIKLIKN